MLAVVVDEAKTEEPPRGDGSPGQPTGDDRRRQGRGEEAGAHAHGGWLTAEEAKFVKDAGVEMLSCAGFGVPVFGVTTRRKSRTFATASRGRRGSSTVRGFGTGSRAEEDRQRAHALGRGVVFGYGTDTVIPSPRGAASTNCAPSA